MSSFRSTWSACAAAAALLAPLGASAATVTVNAGTQLRATMNSELSSKTALVGQVVRMTLVAPYPEDDARFASAALTGKVVAVTKAGRGTKPQLEFVMDKITLRGGQTSAMNARLVSLEAKTKSSAGRVATATLTGMVVGNIVGKWAGTNAGGSIGAVAGALTSTNVKEDVTVPAGATAVLQLTTGLSVKF